MAKADEVQIHHAPTCLFLRTRKDFFSFLFSFLLFSLLLWNKTGGTSIPRWLSHTFKQQDTTKQTQRKGDQFSPPVYFRTGEKCHFIDVRPRLGFQFGVYFYHAKLGVALFFPLCQITASSQTRFV